MKASRKSIHAKLYDFTYMSDLPSNLCPYFWKLIFGFLIFMPNLIIQLPSLIIMMFTKDRSLYSCNNRRTIGIGIYIALAILYGYIYVTFNWIKAMFGFYYYNQDDANVGWIINSIILIGVMVWLVFNFNKKKLAKEEKPNIIYEFFKAKYNRYCPKIDWE